MSEEKMQRQIEQAILDLLENLRKYDSFLLTFTPIKKDAGPTPAAYFEDSMSIASIHNCNTGCIAVSMGHHYGKVLLASEFLGDIAENMGHFEDFKNGFELGEQIAERGTQPDAFIRYKDNPSTSSDSDTSDEDTH